MFKRNGDTSFSDYEYKIQSDTESIIGLYNCGLASALDSWLSALEDDLDKLDLDTTFNYALVNHRKNEERINDCKILSQNFIKQKNILDYNWIGNKLNLLESGSDALEKILKTSELNPKLRNEKEIHSILKSNKAFLLEEKYKRYVYEQHLYYPLSKKYIEIDFINVNHTYYDVPIELFEVKLPNHQFVSRKGLLYNSTKKHFNQIGKRYKDYFSDDTNKAHIAGKIHAPVTAFSLSLLIGRQSDIEEHEYLLNQALGDFELKVNMHSYDSLLEKYRMVYGRIKRFSIS
jgi:hypothetical protein